MAAPPGVLISLLTGFAHCFWLLSSTLAAVRAQQPAVARDAHVHVTGAAVDDEAVIAQPAVADEADGVDVAVAFAVDRVHHATGHVRDADVQVAVAIGVYRCRRHFDADAVPIPATMLEPVALESAAIVARLDADLAAIVAVAAVVPE